jgi:hypothetical protein
MHAFPRSLQILSAIALLWGIGLTAAHSLAIGSLTAPGSTMLHTSASTEEILHSAAYVAMERADAGIQLITGILLILLGFFLHAFARMQNGERPVHISVKPGKNEKRRMWYWIEMRI